MSIAIASDFTNHPKVVVLEAQQLRKPNPNPDIISKHFEIAILRLSLCVYCTLWWASAISMEWCMVRILPGQRWTCDYREARDFSSKLLWEVVIAILDLGRKPHLNLTHESFDALRRFSRIARLSQWSLPGTTRLLGRRRGRLHT
jgi:hypothetical protein